MAIINCPECGKEVSNKAEKCPNCGYPINIVHHQRQMNSTPNRSAVVINRMPQKQKMSGLGIAALIFCILGCTFWIGIILAVIDLCTKDGKKKTCSIIAVVISFFWISICASAINSKDSNSNNNETISHTVNNENKENKIIDYTVSNTTFYTYADSLDNIEYCFILEITNTGTCPLSLEDCYVDFEDKDGHLVSTEKFISSCPDIINPGEKGYFYNGSLALFLDADINSQDEIYAVPHMNITESKHEPVDYTVSDTSITKDSNSPKILGRITNNTKKDNPLLYLNVIFYNSDGDVIGITGTNITDLNSGTTKSFECSGRFVAGDFDFDDIYEYKIIARQ